MSLPVVPTTGDVAAKSAHTFMACKILSVAFKMDTTSVLLYSSHRGVQRLVLSAGGAPLSRQRRPVGSGGYRNQNTEFSHQVVRAETAVQVN